MISSSARTGAMLRRLRASGLPASKAIGCRVSVVRGFSTSSDTNIPSTSITSSSTSSVDSGRKGGSGYSYSVSSAASTRSSASGGGGSGGASSSASGVPDRREQVLTALRTLDLQLRIPGTANADQLLDALRSLDSLHIRVPLTYYMGTAGVLCARQEVLRAELLIHMCRENTERMYAGADVGDADARTKNQRRDSSSRRGAQAEAQAARSRPQEGPLEKLLSYTIAGLFRRGCGEGAAQLWVRMTAAGHVTSRVGLEQLLDKMGSASTAGLGSISVDAGGGGGAGADRQSASLALLTSVQSAVTRQLWHQSPLHYARLLKAHRQVLLRATPGEVAACLQAVDAICAEAQEVLSFGEPGTPGRGTGELPGELLSLRVHCLAAAMMRLRVLGQRGEWEEAAGDEVDTRALAEKAAVALQELLTSAPAPFASASASGSDSGTWSGSETGTLSALTESIRSLARACTPEVGAGELEAGLGAELETGKGGLSTLSSGYAAGVGAGGAYAYREVPRAFSEAMGGGRRAQAMLLCELARAGQGAEALLILDRVLRAEGDGGGRAGDDCSAINASNSSNTNSNSSSNSTDISSSSSGPFSSPSSPAYFASVLGRSLKHSQTLRSEVVAALAQQTALGKHLHLHPHTQTQSFTGSASEPPALPMGAGLGGLVDAGSPGFGLGLFSALRHRDAYLLSKGKWAGALLCEVLRSSVVLDAASASASGSAAGASAAAAFAASAASTAAFVSAASAAASTTSARAGLGTVGGTGAVTGAGVGTGVGAGTDVAVYAELGRVFAQVQGLAYTHQAKPGAALYAAYVDAVTANMAASHTSSISTTITPISWQSGLAACQLLLDTAEEGVASSPLVTEALVRLLCGGETDAGVAPPDAVLRAVELVRAAGAARRGAVTPQALCCLLDAAAKSLDDAMLGQLLSLVETVIPVSSSSATSSSSPSSPASVAAWHTQLLKSRIYAHARVREGFPALKLFRQLRRTGGAADARLYRWLLNGLHQAAPNTEGEWMVAKDPDATVDYLLREMRRDGLKVDAEVLALCLRLFTKAAQIAHKQGGYSQVMGRMEGFVKAQVRGWDGGEGDGSGDGGDGRGKSVGGGGIGRVDVVMSEPILRELIKANCIVGREERALQLLQTAELYGVVPTAACYEPVIYLYSAVKGLHSVADDVLTQMVNRRIPLSEGIIFPLVLGHLKYGDRTEALDLIQDLHNQHQVRPTPSLWVLLLEASLEVGDVPEARRVAAMIGQMYSVGERGALVGPALPPAPTPAPAPSSSTSGSKDPTISPPVFKTLDPSDPLAVPDFEQAVMSSTDSASDSASTSDPTDPTVPISITAEQQQLNARTETLRRRNASALAYWAPISETDEGQELGQGGKGGLGGGLPRGYQLKMGVPLGQRERGALSEQALGRRFIRHGFSLK